MKTSRFEAKLRDEWLAVLEAELASRAPEPRDLADVAEARRQFYEMLDEMHERRKMVVGYREPTPEEQAAHMADLDNYFAELGRRQRNGG